MMGSTRINAVIRDTVIEAMLQTKFALDKAELERLEDIKDGKDEELQTLAYEACYSKKERDLMASLPTGWVGEASYGQVMIDGKVTQINFGYNRPVPHASAQDVHGTKPVSAVLDEGHPYLLKREERRVAAEAHDQFNRDYRERRNSLKVRIRAIIESVTTIKRLIEIWPEVVDFLPEEVSDPVSGVPAVLIADLNADLGITKKAA